MLAQPANVAAELDEGRNVLRNERHNLVIHNSGVARHAGAYAGRPLRVVVVRFVQREGPHCRRTTSRRA